MKYKIKDLITHKISGEWGNESTDGNGVKVIRTANFTNEGIINFDNVVIRQVEERKVEVKKLLPGDIIIEKSGGSPNQPVGRVVFFDVYSDELFLCNNFTTCLRPNTNIVHPRYLFLKLFELHKTGKTLRYQNKTTGIINLKLDNYLEEEIDIPVHMEDQIYIANILNKSEALITQRKESIRLLDELMKSTFLEMFGDPVNNKHDKKYLGELLKVKHGFAFQGEFFSNIGEYVLLTPGNFYEEGGYKDRGEKQKYYTGEIPEEYVLKKGDLLVAMTEQAPGLLGSPIIIPESNRFLHNQRLGLVVFNNEYLNPYYLFHFFNSKSVRKLIHAKATGTKVRHTSPSKIEELFISIPQIKLQNQFAQIVEKVEFQKALYQQSLKELENLYGALSQRAFKGELTAPKKETSEVEMASS